MDLYGLTLFRFMQNWQSPKHLFINFLFNVLFCMHEQPDSKFPTINQCTCTLNNGKEL